jgi:hypothetical protein
MDAVEAAMVAASLDSYNGGGPNEDEVAKLIELKEVAAEDIAAMFGQWQHSPPLTPSFSNVQTQKENLHYVLSNVPPHSISGAVQVNLNT